MRKHATTCENCGKETSILEPRCSRCGEETESETHGTADGINALHRELKGELSQVSSRLNTLNFGTEHWQCGEEKMNLRARIKVLKEFIERIEKYL